MHYHCAKPARISEHYNGGRFREGAEIDRESGAAPKCRVAAPGYVAVRAAIFSPNRSTAAWYSLARSRKRSLARVM